MSVVDVAERTVGQIALPVGVAAECLALTSGGAPSCWRPWIRPPVLLVIDVARAEVRTTLPMAEGWMCMGIAPTPDGRTAPLTYLQSDEDAGRIVVLDLTSWTIAPAAIPLPGGVFGTALSPDGTLLFGTHPLRNKASVFDVASLTIEPLEIDVGGPISVAFTPDGRFALVGRSQDNSVSVNDVPRRRCIPGSFPREPARLGGCHPERLHLGGGERDARARDPVAPRRTVRSTPRAQAFRAGRVTT